MTSFFWDFQMDFQTRVPQRKPRPFFPRDIPATCQKQGHAARRDLTPKHTPERRCRSLRIFCGDSSFSCSHLILSGLAALAQSWTNVWQEEADRPPMACASNTSQNQEINRGTGGPKATHVCQMRSPFAHTSLCMSSRNHASVLRMFKS